MAGNDQNRGFSPDISAGAKKGRRLKPNTAVLIAVIVVLIILALVGVYIFFNDVKVPVVMDLI